MGDDQIWHFELTAAAVGLVVGLAYSLAQGGAPEPSSLALYSLVVILLGQGITPYFYPFGVGLLLGLAYDDLEDEWYGSTVGRSARRSYRARLFLKNTIAVWAKGHLGSGEFVEGTPDVPVWSRATILAAATATMRRIQLASAEAVWGRSLDRMSRDVERP
jgi:hypothetical protein